MDSSSSNEIVPAATASSASNAGSYFSLQTTSKGSSPESTPLTTPGGHPIPAYLRDFPKPSDKLDVESMLSRQPGRWSLQGQMTANKQRTQAQIDGEQLDAKRAQDFEKAKQELLLAHQKLGS